MHPNVHFIKLARHLNLPGELRMKMVYNTKKLEQSYDITAIKMKNRQC